MKVILLEDVKSLGKKDQIVEINDGYARNFIIPKKLGMEATGANLNSLKLQKANEEKVAKELLDHAEAFKQQIESKEVTVAIKAGEGGKAFGSVSSKEIAKAAMDQHGIEIDKKKIQLADPIKIFGTHSVIIKLHPKVTATLNVKVQEA
ncbi:MAG TPA: 50S ribosomal protein L9 [Lachnospiraceae bacterium]|nr:50S ribosomal protein L9 [Lachnospiraceae bacterium]